MRQQCFVLGANHHVTKCEFYRRILLLPHLITQYQILDRDTLDEPLLQHLALQLDLFYQDGRRQLLGYLPRLLNVNLTYHRHDVSAGAHAQQLAAHHLDQLQPLLTLKRLLAVLPIGDLNVAIETIRAAKKAGADAIKLQTYTPDTLTIDCNNEHFKIEGGTLWDGKTLYELYGEAYTPWSWHKQLFEVAREEGLICFSSPFDTTAVDFLEKLNVPAYKIASFEIQDISLIAYTASKGKPIFA